MATRKHLTARDCETAKPRATEYTLWDPAPRGSGRLGLRVTPKGARTWWAKFEHEGVRERVRLGPYASPVRAGDTPLGLTLEDAREEFRRLADIHREHGSVRAYQAAQAEAREREEAARVAAARSREDEQSRTLAAMLALYVAHLERQGKASAADTRRAFRAYVEPQPIADKLAREVSGREVSALLRELVEQGKGRTAAKLRAMLAAAYGLAARAESDATAPSALLAFKVEADPMSTVAARGFAQFTRTRDRVLTRAELRAFWKHASALEGVTGDALRLYALLAGQRIAQLLRAEVADYDADAQTLTLRDPKGRRIEPRAHVLPLAEPALGIVQRLATERRRAVSPEHRTGWRYLLANEPDTHLRAETVDRAFLAVLAAMQKAGEVEGEPFQLRDVRRTAETMLAAEGVSAEVRAHLQSHGLGGVQQRHYVRHDFMAEKEAALRRWLALLGVRQSGKVVSLKRARRA